MILLSSLKSFTELVFQEGGRTCPEIPHADLGDLCLGGLRHTGTAPWLNRLLVYLSHSKSLCNLNPKQVQGKCVIVNAMQACNPEHFAAHLPPAENMPKLNYHSAVNCQATIIQS